MIAPQPEPVNMMQEALAYLMEERSIFPVCNPTWELHYHWRDGKVQPCINPGKTPMVKWADYQKRPPTEEDIAQWWTKWPDANIGMATGAISSVVVLDADGIEARKTVMAKGITETPVIFTGREGGTHYWFQHPGFDTHNFAGKLAHVDFRGDGGYVLLPPSLHKSGERYRWAPHTSGLPLAPVPEWLLALLTASPDAADHEPLDMELITNGIPEGGRDDTLWKYACKMRGDDVSIEYARAFIISAARDCHPPFDEAAALEKVERAYREYPAGRTGPTFVLSSATPAQSVPQPPQAAYPVQNLQSLLDTSTIALPELVEGLLWSGRTHWFFSAPNSGKTLMLIAMGMHIAAGRDFHGRTVQQGPVLFIEEDTPLSVIAEYVAMLADIYEFDLNTLPFYITAEPGLRITDPAGAQRFMDIIDRCPERPTLVVFDACERIVPSDSFSTKELDPFTTVVQRLTAQHITVAVIDHTRKQSNAQVKRKGDEVIHVDPIDLLYGGRAKSAIADIMVYITGKVSSDVTLSFCKFRGEAPDPFTVGFNPDDGFIFQAPGRGRTKTPTEAAIISWFNHGHSQTWHASAEIIPGADVKERTAERAIANLVRRKWLFMEGSRKEAKYCLNTKMPGIFG